MTLEAFVEAGVIFKKDILRFQGPRNDILSRGGWQGAIAWSAEKIKFIISQTVANTSYFYWLLRNYKNWLYQQEQLKFYQLVTQISDMFIRYLKS